MDNYIGNEEVGLKKKRVISVVSSFIGSFMEIYNAGAAFILIFLIGQILLMMRKVDRDLLKARLFLNDAVLNRTWMYISVAGASFALNTLVKFAVKFTPTGMMLNDYYMVEATQFVFLIAFIMAVYSWYVFIGSFVSRELH